MFLIDICDPRKLEFFMNQRTNKSILIYDGLAKLEMICLLNFIFYFQFSIFEVLTFEGSV